MIWGIIGITIMMGVWTILGILINTLGISKDQINEDLLSKYMYTKKMPDPDLIIRPSGELRLSNFLLWQSAYSELWFSDINWPDFHEKQLRLAISDYQKRDRRFGKVK